MDLGALTSFDKSTFKRVLDLLEPGDLRLGQSCSSRAWSEQWKWRWWKCFGIEVSTDTAKLANMVIARFGER